MKKISIGALAVSSTLLSPIAAYAETEVHFWHAFTGRLGELVAAQVEDFNASQDNYTVVQSHKGNYSETLNAGIAAFRAGEQPQILMVFEVGTATMMAAKGATRPVYEVMAASGAEFDQDAYIGAVKGYYTSTDGDMLSLPFNASTPVLWVNRDAFKAAGVDPDTDLSTWQNVDKTLTALKAGGSTVLWSLHGRAGSILKISQHITMFHLHLKTTASLDWILNCKSTETHKLPISLQWANGPKMANLFIRAVVTKGAQISAPVNVLCLQKAPLATPG